MTATGDFIAFADPAQASSLTKLSRKRAHSPGDTVSQKRPKFDLAGASVKPRGNRTTFLSLALELRQDIMSLVVNDAFAANRALILQQSDPSDARYADWYSTRPFRLHVEAIQTALADDVDSELFIEHFPALQFALKQLRNRLKLKLGEAQEHWMLHKTEVDAVETLGIGPLLLAKKFREMKNSFRDSEEAAGRGRKDHPISYQFAYVLEGILGRY